jgi:hypothetical protein
MKKFCLTTQIAVFLLICLNGVQAQTETANPDQIKFIQALKGTWKSDISKDTVMVVEYQQYGNSMVEYVSRVINGKKDLQIIYLFSVPSKSKENKFKGFGLYASGNYATFLASAVSEKKFIGDWVLDFNPEAVTGRFEMVLETPTNLIFTYFNSKGAKTGEDKMYKVK